jgi:hypothetical protein
MEDTPIRLSITPEGCPTLEFDYIKTCGAEFKPHPGVTIRMFDGRNSQPLLIVRDGIVNFAAQSRNRAVDKFVRNFEIKEDSVLLQMTAEISPEL